MYGFLIRSRVITEVGLPSWPFSTWYTNVSVLGFIVNSIYPYKPWIGILTSYALYCLLRGRFMADDYFTILHGEQWAFQTGKFDKEVYRPGDMHLMSRGVSKQYRMPSDCWALEYARGNILSMIPFGLLDTFTSTMDLVTLHQTVYVSLKGMTFNLLKGKIWKQKNSWRKGKGIHHLGQLHEFDSLLSAPNVGRFLLRTYFSPNVAKCVDVLRVFWLLSFPFRFKSLISFEGPVNSICMVSLRHTRRDQCKQTSLRCRSMRPGPCCWCTEIVLIANRKYKHAPLAMISRARHLATSSPVVEISICNVWGRMISSSDSFIAFGEVRKREHFISVVNQCRCFLRISRPHAEASYYMCLIWRKAMYILPAPYCPAFLFHWRRLCICCRTRPWRRSYRNVGHAVLSICCHRVEDLSFPVGNWNDFDWKSVWFHLNFCQY